MRARKPSAVLRLLAALALPAASICAPAPRAWAQTAPPKPPPLPSGGPAAAHAHPPQKPQSVIVPVAPPPAPVLPPPIAVPTRPPPPPPPPPVAGDAPGTANATTDGLRVTFGADRADLSPETDSAIGELAKTAPGPDATFTVTAYAAGGDDPSTPRRLSLSRALAVRSALMQAGVASVRIYVKALGASAPGIAEGPPDRVDIVMTAAPAGQPTTAASPTQKAAP